MKIVTVIHTFNFREFFQLELCFNFKIPQVSYADIHLLKLEFLNLHCHLK